MDTLEQQLSQVWKGNRKMIDHCLKSSVYINMGDYYLEVIDIPRIDKTIYYPDIDYSTGDMAKDPGTAFQTFRNYNIRLNSPAKAIEFIEKGQEVVIRKQYYRGGDQLKSWQTKYHSQLLPEDRVATPAEREKLLAALRDELAKYEKRLVAYYKRYGKYVGTSSYWADR